MVDKGDFDEHEHNVTLPSTQPFAAVTDPLELRIYAFGAQFTGHRTSLTRFKLTRGSAVRRGAGPCASRGLGFALQLGDGKRG
jgi:hypothetical protein